jgi:NAD(P)-dependent dehydrogenase (short-subunit alcohol dehydrogenase family)
MGSLREKVAIVTGAGRGIGREIALQFAEEGAKVVVNDLGANPDGREHSKVADEVVAEIKAAGGDAVANYDTVATVEGGRNIFQTAMDTYGAVDILVNNAGILRDKTLFNMEEEDWDAVIAVHLKGHYCCTRPFAQYIRETSRQNCRILNYSSISGLYGNFGQTNYGAAKGGIAAFSRVLALELARYNTEVITISPAASTRLTIPLRDARGEDTDVDGPLRSPKQIATVTTWLASDASKGMSGQIIDVMQGWVGIMQQPAVIRSFKKEDFWTLADLNKVMPKLLDAKKAHDEYVKEKGAPEDFS